MTTATHTRSSPGPLPARTNVPGPVAQRLTELEAFCLRAGRRPCNGAGDPQEASLAEWVRRLRQSRTYRPYLDEVIFAYPAHDPYRLQRLRDFINVHGHRPAKRSDDPVERKLASWASQARYLADPEPQLLELMDRTPTSSVHASQQALGSAHMVSTTDS